MSLKFKTKKHFSPLYEWKKVFFLGSRLTTTWCGIFFFFFMDMMAPKFHILKMMKLMREGEQLSGCKASLIKHSAAKQKKGSHGWWQPPHYTLNPTVPIVLWQHQQSPRLPREKLVPKLWWTCILTILSLGGLAQLLKISCQALAFWVQMKKGRA